MEKPTASRVRSILSCDHGASGSNPLQALSSTHSPRTAPHRLITMPKKGSKTKAKASKAAAPAPAAPKENPLYPNAPRNHRIGGAVRVCSGSATSR